MQGASLRGASLRAGEKLGGCVLQGMGLEVRGKLSRQDNTLYMLKDRASLDDKKCS